MSTNSNLTQSLLGMKATHYVTAYGSSGKALRTPISEEKGIKDSMEQAVWYMSLAKKKKGIVEVVYSIVLDNNETGSDYEVNHVSIVDHWRLKPEQDSFFLCEHESMMNKQSDLMVELHAKLSLE